MAKPSLAEHTPCYQRHRVLRVPEAGQHVSGRVDETARAVFNPYTFPIEEGVGRCSRKGFIVVGSIQSM